MLKNRKGFTLIELIITMFIVVLVFMMLSPLFMTGINFFRDSNGMVMDQVNLRKIMTDLSREIRDATTVNVVSSTEIDVGDSTYIYLVNEKQITKYLSATDTTVVISKRVELFEIVENDDVIEIRVMAEGAGSTIVTKVSVREDKTLRSPPIGD